MDDGHGDYWNGALLECGTLGDLLQGGARACAEVSALFVMYRRFYFFRRASSAPLGALEAEVEAADVSTDPFVSVGRSAKQE